MELYCTNCGEKVRENADFCFCCGTAVRHQKSNTKRHADSEWEKMAFFLGKSSLGIAKAFAIILIGGAVMASAVSAIGMIIVACFSLYQFANGSVVAIPWFLIGDMPAITMSGAPLAFGGLMAVMIAILFLAMTWGLVKCIRSFWKEKFI